MTTNTWKAVAGGLAGTLLMTGLMYGAAPMMGLRMDIAAMLGSLLGGSWIAGLLMHFVNGSLIFPLVFTRVLQDRLPGPAAVRGVLWGVSLWLVAQAMVMPMMGAGFFSAHAGGVMAAAASLVGHLFYGATLGTIAGVANPLRSTVHA